MTLKDWLTVLSPEICVILGLLITALFSWWTGTVPKISAWLTAHHQSAVAQQFAAANAVLQPLLQTGANAILDKIRTGQINLADKASIEAEAHREVALVEARAPQMVAAAAPVAGALVASMIGKVQAGSAAVAAPVEPTVVQAAQAINSNVAALQSIGMTVGPLVSVVPTTPLSPTT